MPTGRKDGMPFTTKSKDETISGALGISEDRATEIKSEVAGLLTKTGTLVSDDLLILMKKFEDKEIIFACFQYGVVITKLKCLVDSGLDEALKELREIIKD